MKRRVYAIVRVEGWADANVKLVNKITIVKIVSDHEVAVAEVERLSHLNQDSTYFLQATRIDHEDSMCQ